MSEIDIIETILKIFFSVTFFILIGLMTIVLIDEMTSEYKYSIDVPCYDRFGNEIMNLTCEENIKCGKVFKTKMIGNEVYSCDENLGFIRKVNQEGSRE